MIAIPQIKIMETQTPYGKTTVRIIRSPNVINYAKRGTLIATRWLASSPYAKYQEMADEMTREYTRRLSEWGQQIQRWMKEQEHYTTTQIKQLRLEMEEHAKAWARDWAKRNADVVYIKMVNAGVSPDKAKEIVLDMLTSSFVPFSEATDIVVNLEKKYKPKIQPSTSTPSYSSGSSSRSSHSSSSLIKPVYQDIVYSGSTPSLATQPSISSSTSSTPTDISSKIEKVNEAAEKASSTGYREVPTNVPGVTAVVDESGNITGYHDYVRGVCSIEPPKPSFEYCNPYTNPYYTPYACSPFSQI